MARNANKFTKISDVEGDAKVAKVDEVTKDILNGADLKTAEVKNKGGRKPKEVEDVAKDLLRVYVTKSRKIAIEEHCKKKAISISSFINQLLVNEGVI